MRLLQHVLSSLQFFILVVLSSKAELVYAAVVVGSASAHGLYRQCTATACCTMYGVVVVWRSPYCAGHMEQPQAIMLDDTISSVALIEVAVLLWHVCYYDN